MNRLLLATGNPAKVGRIREFLAGLPVEIVSPLDLGLALDVVEDGATVEENAARKAHAYHAASGLPALATDASVNIDRFPPEAQPGLLVRRTRGAAQDVAGADVLDDYARRLRAAGGTSAGTWRVALALVTAAGDLLAETFELQVLFTAEASPARHPGEPLSSLMRDPATGRYYADMPGAARPDAAPIRAFVARHLARM